MYQLTTPLFIRNITPMHVGSGNDLGFVDLPIQREKHTQYPKIEASSLKGCIREYFENTAENLEDVYMVHNLFGYDNGSLNQCLDEEVSEEQRKKVKTDFESDRNRSQFAGAVGFTDARILFFPVKSVSGVFAYVTCPSVLNKWVEELKLCKIAENEKRLEFLDDLKPETALCFLKNKLKVEKTGQDEKFVVLEDYLFKFESISSKEKQIKDNDNESLFSKYLRTIEKVIGDFKIFKQHVAIINDDDFKDFVNLSTEVITRTKIDNTSGTVADGALFNEEYLPAETIMYSLAMYSPAFSALMPNESYAKIFTANDVQNAFEKIFGTKENNSARCIQIGAGATIGKGICKIGKCGEVR